MRPQWRAGGAASTSPRRVTSRGVDQPPPRRPTTSGSGSSNSSASNNYLVGLRGEYAELAGNCAAQHYEVNFVQCCRQKGRLVCRLLPQPGGVYDCPITGDAMREPVMLCDGHVYDREAIERWFTHGRQTSPLTNLPLASLGCMPLLPLRKAIETFLNRRPEVCSFREGEVQELQAMVDRVQVELDETREALALSRSMEVDLLRQLQEASRKVSAATAAAAAAASREAACNCGCSSGPPKGAEEVVLKAISILKAAMRKAGRDWQDDNADVEEARLDEDLRGELMEALAASKTSFDEEAQEYSRLKRRVEKLLGVEQHNDKDKVRPSPKCMLRRRSDPGAMALSARPGIAPARATSCISSGKPAFGKRLVLAGHSTANNSNSNTNSNNNSSNNSHANANGSASTTSPGSIQESTRTVRSPTLKTRGLAMRRGADNRISPVRQQVPRDAGAAVAVNHGSRGASSTLGSPAVPSPSPPPSSLKLQRPGGAPSAPSVPTALSPRSSEEVAAAAAAATTASESEPEPAVAAPSSSLSSSTREDHQAPATQPQEEDSEQRSSGSSSSRSSSSASAASAASAATSAAASASSSSSAASSAALDRASQGYNAGCRRDSSSSSSASTSCPATATPEACQTMTEEERGKIEEEIFVCLTTRSGRDTLDEDALKVFASLCGFVGTPTEWRAEYLAICNDYGSEPETGLKLDEYQKFLRDRDGSAYCTPDDLIWLRESLAESCTEAARRSIWSLSGWDRWPVCKATCGADLKLRAMGESLSQSAASSGGA